MWINALHPLSCPCLSFSHMDVPKTSMWETEIWTTGQDFTTDTQTWGPSPAASFVLYQSFNPMALNTCLCLLPSSVTGSTASQFPRQSCFPMPCLPRALCFHAALCLRPLGLLPLSTSYIVGANITGPAAARTSFWEVVVLRPSFHQE